MDERVIAESGPVDKNKDYTSLQFVVVPDLVRKALCGTRGSFNLVTGPVGGIHAAPIGFPPFARSDGEILIGVLDPAGILFFEFIGGGGRIRISAVPEFIEEILLRLEVG